MAGRSTVVGVTRMSAPGGASVSTGSGGIPPLDGEVTSSAQIVTVANNSANAGKSYWMRGGSYGTLTLGDTARPSSLITFVTYPGEQVLFADVVFTGCANLRFDGNVNNMVREPAGTALTDYMEGDYGLWFQGSGIAGNEIPDVGNCVTLAISNPPDWNENLQFAHFRVGDEMAPADDGDGWRRQHGFVLCNGSRDILVEDAEIAYLGFDQDPTEGDADGGGYGIQFYSVAGPDAADWGDVTIRRVHVHHTMNDFVTFESKNDDGIAEVLFEDCLFDVLINYGLAHADFLQVLGGSTKLTYRDCVFQWGSDFLLHGDNPGATRLFENCLIGNPNEADNAHQIVLGKDIDFGLPSYGASDYEWRNCTINMETEDIQIGSADGAAETSNNVVANSIWGGASSPDGVVIANSINNDGQPNVFVTGSSGTKLATDVTGAPTYNSDGDCTSHSQGYRKSATFPWSI